MRGMGSDLFLFRSHAAQSVCQGAAQNGSDGKGIGTSICRKDRKIGGGARS